MSTSFHGLTNNATGTLKTAITNASTSIVLESGEGGEFPAAGKFYITLFGTTVEEGHEIVEVQSRSSDTLEVTGGRGSQSTSAASWPIGTYVQLLWTAAHGTELQTAVNALEDGTAITTKAYTQDMEIREAGASAIPGITFNHSRGTLASRSSTQALDHCGELVFQGYNLASLAYYSVAKITGQAVTNAPALSDSPGVLNFYVSPDASSTPELALTISSDKILKAGSSTVSLTDATGHIQTSAIKTGTTNSGNFLIAGGTEGSATFATPGATTFFVAGTGSATNLTIQRSRGTTSSPSAVADTDAAYISFKFYDAGGTYSEAARISGFVNGTPGSGDMPGGLSFYTTVDGLGSPGVTPVFQLSTGQLVGIGGAPTNGKLEITESNTFAKPLIYLNQQDQDFAFMTFAGTSAADKTKNISTAAFVGFTYTGMVKVKVGSTDYWVPYYA